MTELKVGARVRVTRDTLTANIGKTGIVIDLDPDDSFYPYRVQFDTGGDDWVSGVVELLDPAEDIKVGDRVEVTVYRLADCAYNGRAGVVRALDDDDIPYFVEFDDGDRAWAREVRKLEPATSANPFVAHVEEAKKLLASTDHTGTDIITLARELADRA